LTAKDELLTADEIGRVVKIFAAAGVDKVRLTGGEPTLRKDL
jgi:cyclic pyranopterin phosphate synthase